MSLHQSQKNKSLVFRQIQIHLSMLPMLFQAVLKRAQELTPTPQEQAAVLNLVTKISSVLDNLVVAPGNFEAAVRTIVQRSECFIWETFFYASQKGS